MAKPLLFLLGAAVALSACSDPLVFPDWTVEVPDGVRVIEYAGTPLDERNGEPIRMLRDLEIGRGTDDPDYSFYRPYGLAVDDDGRMYVGDSGTSQMVVHDADGRFIRRFGRQGQGPGEFGDIYEATYAAGEITVLDGDNHRLSKWDTDGNQVAAFPLFDRALGNLSGLDDGTYVGSYTHYFREGRREGYMVHIAMDGALLNRIARLPQLGPGTGTFGVPHPRAVFTASRDGSIYMTPGREYEVFAYRPDGEMRWALRSTWKRHTVTQQIVDGLDPYLQALPEQQRPQVEWPELMPALQFVWVDGHGHLYVVPYEYVNEALMLGTVTGNPRWAELGSPPPAPDLLPVDVYSADGELLFAGMIESGGQHTLGWQAARGDHIYRLSTDWDTGERFLERFRLNEPF